MKRALMVLAMCAILSVFADTWTDPSTEITWTYAVSDGQAQVQKSEPATGAVSIPTMLGVSPVTSIGTGAFSDCSGLTSVTIPSSVTSLGYCTFSGCTNLTLRLECACPADYEDSGVKDVREVVFPSDQAAYDTYSFRNHAPTFQVRTSAALYIDALGALQLIGSYHDERTFTQSYSYLEGWVGELRSDCHLAVLLLRGSYPLPGGLMPDVLMPDELIPITPANIATSYFGGWTVHVRPPSGLATEAHCAELVLCSKIYHGFVDSASAEEWSYALYHLPGVEIATGRVYDDSVTDVRQGDVIAFRGNDGDYFDCTSGSGESLCPSVEGEPCKWSDLSSLYLGRLVFSGTCHRGVYYWRVPSVNDSLNCYSYSYVTFDEAAPYRRFWLPVRRYTGFWNQMGDTTIYTVLPDVNRRTISFRTGAFAVSDEVLCCSQPESSDRVPDPWTEEWESVSLTLPRNDAQIWPVLEQHLAGWEVVPGAAFAGWVEDGSGLFYESLSGHEFESGRDWSFTACYDVLDYAIDYVDTRGQVVNNPSAYSITNSCLAFRGLPDVPGWNFSGWSPKTIVAGTTGDLVVTALWERVYHDVGIAATHGRAQGEGSYEYGSKISLQAPDVVWNGSQTNFVCLGSSSFLPLTNVVDVVMTNDVSFAWDVWQTNFLYRTVGNPAGEWCRYGDERTETAVPAPGHRFYKWIGDVAGDVYENPKTFVMTQARYVEPVFVEEKVATPIVSVPNGTVLSNTTRSVTLTCATPGSTIYYTLDGTIPSATNGSRYSGAFPLGKTALVQAVAVKAGSDASEVASSAVIWLAAGDGLPRVSIAPGTSVQEADRTTVTMTCAENIGGLALEVRYTLDGSEPTATSALYEKRFSVRVSQPMEVHAATFVNGVRVGEVVRVRYVPTISDVIVRSGEGCGEIEVFSEADNEWTIDGPMVSPCGLPSMRSNAVGPDSRSEMYAIFLGPGVLEFNWRTSCEKDEFDEFYYDHAEFLMNGELVARLDGETAWSNVVVSVDRDAYYELTWRYVKDGDDDTPYPGGDCVWVSDVKFSFAAFVSFSAGEYAAGAAPDGIVSSAGYSVTLPGCGGLAYSKHAFVGWQYGDRTYAEGDRLVVDAQQMALTPVWAEKVLPLPEIDVAAEYDEESVLVTLSCKENADIRYTTDGSDPNADSPQYAGPFWVTGTATIKAMAMGDDWYDSPVASAETQRSWTSLEDCLGADGFALATGGDRNWIGDAEAGCVKSVELAEGETSWFTATCEGVGVAEWLYRSPTNDWTLCSVVFSGGGTHVLRWEGGGCMVRALTLKEAAWASFASADPVSGSLPDPICSTAGYVIALPDAAGFSRAKHTFDGWSDGVNRYSPGESYVMTGDVAFVPVWTPNLLVQPEIVVDSWYDEEKTAVKILSSDRDVTVYYTLDGSLPSRASLVYTGEFEVAGSYSIKAIAIKEDCFDSSVVEATTVRAPWTINECLGNASLVFATGGDSDWSRCSGASEDGYCMRSGALGDGQVDWIETTVVGEGDLAFVGKVSSEETYRGQPYDYLSCSVDGCVRFWIAGEIAWTNVTLHIPGAGSHVVRWSYQKDPWPDTAAGEDCAWIDSISWTPTAAPADPIPDLGENPTAEQVAAALAGSADAALAAHIADGASYNAYRAWAESVKGADGQAAGAQAVKASQTAWLSFALGCETLLATAPEALTVEAFEPTAEGGRFAFTVDVKDVTVGSAATAENLKQVFGLEGGASPGALSAENVNLTFGTPENGKVKFTAGPKDPTQPAFFMKVKLTP